MSSRPLSPLFPLYSAVSHHQTIQGLITFPCEEEDNAKNLDWVLDTIESDSDSDDDDGLTKKLAELEARFSSENTNVLQPMQSRCRQPTINWTVCWV